MAALYWLITIASLVAMWLNVRRHAACFAIWAITNSAWTIVDYAHGLAAQAGLQAVYLGFSFYGLWTWSRQVRAPRESRPVGETQNGTPVRSPE